MNISLTQLITDLNSLTENNGKAAWETASGVRVLFKSKEYVREFCGSSPDKRDENLAMYTGRFALSLSDMLNMLNYFPHEEEWADGRLDVLRDEAAKKLSQKLSGNRKSVDSRHGSSVTAMLNGVSQHAKSLESDIAAKDEDLSQSKAEIARLLPIAEKVREVEHKAKSLEQQLAEWKERAITALQRVSDLETELNEKERVIEQLRRQISDAAKVQLASKATMASSKAAERKSRPRRQKCSA